VEEIRRAYRRLAQRYHPDRHLQSTATEASRAAERMRDINGAWRVLSDPATRERYDLELSLERVKAQRQAWQPRPAPATAAARSTATPPRPAYHGLEIDVAPSYGIWTAILRAVPWLLVIVVLGGIFVFTAFAASQQNGTASKEPVVAPTAHVGECIRWLSNTELGIVDCDRPNNGRIVDKVAVGTPCPTGTAGTWLPDEHVFACVARS
jgi:hypothetical protein